MKRKLSNSLRMTRNKKAQVVNTVKYDGGSISVSYQNGSTDEVEILIYSEIGEDPWSDRGFTAKDLRNALKDVPKNRDLNVRVNSPGGEVFEGFAIKATLDEWQGKVTVTIDGVAASTASWMILGADNVRARKLSNIFIHDALTFTVGNEQDHLDAAKDLGKMSNQIADVYAEKSGSKMKDWRDRMREGQLMTGEEAMELGLVDEIIDEAPVSNFTADNLAKMRKRLGGVKNSATRKEQEVLKKEEPQIIMNRTQMIALLNKWGRQIRREGD
jgi:ATP-dependent protease ClpP protease subunit